MGQDSPRTRLTKSEKHRLRREARDAQYREWQAAQPTVPKKPRRTSGQRRCGDVTITRPDGTVTVVPALTVSQVRRIAPERLLITPVMRTRVLRRDNHACRYCRTTVGPFEMDHVMPVALGGATIMRNLVTACSECNRRKGARIWRPLPIPPLVSGWREPSTLP